MINQKIAIIFYEMAELLEMEKVVFKPQAFRKAAHSIESLDEDLKEVAKKGIKALEEIPGVGEGIAERIEEYIKTGKIKDYEKLKRKLPVNVFEFTSIEGVGPELIKLFYEKLKVKNINDLEKAAKTGKISSLPRCGKKLEQKILKGIEFYKKSHARFLLGDTFSLAKDIEKRLKRFGKVALAGSLRRWQETIGDLDVLIACNNRAKQKAAMDYFVSMPEVDHVYARGLKKSMVRLDNGLDVDLRVVEEKSFGAALQYFTGNKAHNIELRKIAMKKKYKLNEYGLFRGNKYVAGKTEKEIYEKLGLQFIPPEMRTDSGEIELAQKNKLPKVIEQKDIKGDLQLQTNWTDGSNSIEDYVKKAEELGYEYILITDHTKSLAMTGGLDERGLLKQMKAIEKVDAKSKIKILKGAEVNIMKDGSLDIEDEVLEKLDVVGAAIHSHFKLSKKEQTARMVRAMENPHVDIIFHPTTRVIQKRPEMELDMEEIFKAAKKTGTVLEINAFPSRLDLRDDYIREAKKHGVKFSIDTDSHSVHHMDFMKFGVCQARRGWCEKGDVINTLPLKKFMEFFKKPKKQRF